MQKGTGLFQLSDYSHLWSRKQAQGGTAATPTTKTATQTFCWQEGGGFNSEMDVFLKWWRVTKCNLMSESGFGDTEDTWTWLIVMREEVME